MRSVSWPSSCRDCGGGIFVPALVALLTLLGWAAPVRAAPRLDRFYLPVLQNPEFPTRGPDGAVWFTVDHALARVSADGKVTLHPTPGLEPVIPTAGPDGAVWFIGNNAGAVGRIGPDGAFTTFRRGLSNYDLAGITTGSDGNLWIGAGADNAVLRMTPGGAVTAVIRLPRGAEPSDVTLGPDGNVWFIGEGGVGSVTPLGQARLIRVDLSGLNTITAGPDGNLWLSDEDGRSLIRITPRGAITHVPINLESTSIAAGPDGNVWFAFYGGVGRIRPDGTDRVLYREPFGTFGPEGIAFDSTGNLWGTAFSEYSLERLSLGPEAPAPLEPILRRDASPRGLYTVAAGTDGAMWLAGRRAILRFDSNGQTVFRPQPAPNGSLVASQGGKLWFGFGGRGVARLTPNGRVRRFVHGFPRKARVYALTLAPNGALWFIDDRSQTVGRRSPDGKVRMFKKGLGRRRDLLTLTVGPDHRIWLTDQNGAILSMSTSGHVRRLTHGLGPHPSPTAITSGPDGNLWFTDFGSRQIGRITPSGHVTRWRPREMPASIAAGPDGALWFTTAAVDTDDTASGIGRITTRGAIREFFVRGTYVTGFEALAPGPDGKIWFVESKGPVALARMAPQRLMDLGSLQRPRAE
jgi:streptogramin lyase